MKFVKLFSVVLAFAAGIYLIGCSSAEQTTAKLAYQQGDFAKAEVEFEKETKQNPQNEEAWVYLALSRARQGKLEGTKTAFSEYTKIGKNTYKNEVEIEFQNVFNEGVKKFTAAESMEKAKNNEGALKSYKEALNYFLISGTLMPSDTNSSNNSAVAQERINFLLYGPVLAKADEYFNAGKYQESITEYKTALTMIGDNNKSSRENVLNLLSIAYLKWAEDLRVANDDKYKEKYTEALPYIEELNKTDNKELKITTYDWLVVIYGHLGRNADAENAMKLRDALKNQ